MNAGLLVANAACAWFLAGLIWTIQLVHYPLFAKVGREGFAAYEAAHSRMITPLVGPVMLAELAVAVALVAVRPRAVPAWAAWTLLALVGAIWLSTFAVQVPAHGTLARGFDEDAHARLVASNWIRTAAWTARAAILGWLLAQAVGAKEAPGA